MAYNTKTQRQRKAYKQMINNHNKYKAELKQLVGKGNPDYLSPGKFGRYVYLIKKIDNTDPTLKYKNTEKQIEAAKKQKTFERKTFDTVSESSESVASNRLEEWSDSDSDTEDVLIAT